MEPLLTMDEAAQLLKLTAKQMYELTRNRSRSRQAVPIPIVKIGKRRMFRASSLNEWVLKLERA